MFIESVFEAQQFIPSQYTCEGENISPPLQFMQVPAGVQSLVLIVDDPDAPQGTFDHWVVWNLPPNLEFLSEGAPELQQLSPKPQQGKNSYGVQFYKGPCPPPGNPHHYHFKLYALDTQLFLQEDASKDDVEKAMDGHVVDQAELVGLYQRD